MPPEPGQREDIHFVGVTAGTADGPHLRARCEQMLDTKLIGCRTDIADLFNHARW
jgi:hypothetical protein